VDQKGESVSMASCGYPYYLGGVFEDPKLLIATPAGAPRDPEYFFRQKKITAYVETEANPIKPSNEGLDLQGIKTLHSLENAIKLKEMIKNDGSKKKAVVVGSGLIGIETCEVLQFAGIEKAVNCGFGIARQNVHFPTWSTFIYPMPPPFPPA